MPGVSRVRVAISDGRVTQTNALGRGVPGREKLGPAMKVTGTEWNGGALKVLVSDGILVL